MKALLSAVFILLAPCVAVGQTQAEQTPKPSPQAQALGYYVGTWKGHGETKGGPFGAAGKLSSKMTCTWFDGRFQVVCRGEETGPSGTRGFLNILSYDDKTKSYSEYAISSLGDTEDDKGGSLVDGKLTFLLDGGGTGPKAVKIRYTEMHVSPVLYNYRAEAAIGGGPWAVVAQGEIAKVR